MLCGDAGEDGRKYFQVCIFDCEDGKHFFKIPKNPKTRKVWLDKLGLKSVSLSSRICNNHFSQKMFTKAGKRIKKNGFPDRNIRILNGYADTKYEGTSSDHIESLMDEMLSKKDVSNKITKSKSLQLMDDFQFKTANPQTNETRNRATANFIGNSFDIASSSIQTIELRGTQAHFGNSSNSLMNYQLQEHDNIVEIPQFLIVFTAFRANDTVIIPPADLIPQYNRHVADAEPEEGNTILEEEDLWKETDATAPEKPVREISYVPYEPPKIVIRRARETQVDMAAEITKTTTAVQCDLDEQGTVTSDDSPQLEWINHLIENHVFNAEGDLYECHICGEIAASYASNLRHAMVHKERSSLCFECGRLFPNHVKLKYHEKKAHQPMDLEIKKALRCPKFHCTKAFHSKRQLYEHIDKHTTGGEYKCDKCWRIFSSFVQFHIHKSRRNCLR